MSTNTQEQTKKYDELYRSILASRRILLCSHGNPDGDALGSLCSMVGFLRSLGKEYKAFCAGTTNLLSENIPWAEEINTNEESLRDFLPDLVLLLDVSNLKRSGIDTFLSRFHDTQYSIAVIDHHSIYPKHTKIDIEIIEPQRSSTTELLYSFFKHINYAITPRVALALLTGVLTDTEFFGNQSTTLSALTTTKALLKHNIPLRKLSLSLQRWREYIHLKVIGIALERLRYHIDLGVLVTVIRNDDFRARQKEDTVSGITNLLKQTNQGTIALMLFVCDGTIRGSIRSIHPQVNVARFAKIFGGGGHDRASGFTIPGDIFFLNNTWRVV